jgi:hypothetical protein
MTRHLVNSNSAELLTALGIKKKGREPCYQKQARAVTV